MRQWWDFLWTATGKPDWVGAEATFNPHVPNDLVLKLYVRSLDEAKAQALADRGLLPDDWRGYLVG